MPPHSLVDAALYYASIGWYVFPLGDESKEPITGHGHLDATTAPEQIRKWWTEHPDARIGIYLRKSGLIALDVDPRNGGTATLADLERRCGPLPRTNHQRSGGGGEHVLLRDPSPGPDGWTRTHDTGGSARGKLPPGVDLKINGYIVAEPSGSYEWISLQPENVQPVPEAWIPLMRKSAEECALDGAGIEAWRESVGELNERDAERLRQMLRDLGPRGGGKSTTCAAVKLVFHAFGLSVPDGAPYLLQWNAGNGKPYAGAELLRQVIRVSSVPDGNSRGWARGLDVSSWDTPPANANTSNTPSSGAKRYGVDAADFLATEDENGDPYTVAGLIPEGMPAMIVGPPKSGKSWIMLYVALCIAKGLPTFGRATKRGRVLVIAREDTARETRRRLRLIMRALGVEPEQLRGWLRVDSVQPLYLDLQTDVEALSGTLADYKPAVVLIDSLARVHNQDENSRTEMARVMNVWSDLCSRHSCSVVLLHHMVKWDPGGTLIQRIRGTGDIGAMLRVAIGVTRTGDDTSRIEVDGNLADMTPTFTVAIRDVHKDGLRYATSITVASGGTSGVEGNPLSDPLIGDLADALHDAVGQRMTTKALRKGNGGRQLVDAALKVMESKGLIQRVMRGAKHCGYVLTESGKVFAAGPPSAPATGNGTTAYADWASGLQASS